MKTELPKVLQKARAEIVLDHPFFASILLRHPMVADTSIKTCCVNSECRIRYNPKFMEGLTTNQAVHLLCHEILHYVGLDSLRVGSRDKKKWNHVADEWINDTLAKLKIGEPIPGEVSRPGASESTREGLYEMLPPDDKDPGQGPPSDGDGQGDADGQGAPGNGDGKNPMGNDIEQSENQTESQKNEQEAKVKMEVAEAGQAAKMRGNLPAILQKLVSDTIDSKVPWYDILERFMTERVKNDVTWSRPNRRYMPDFYLPTIDGVGAMGPLIVQVDISGSVSREEIKHYNGHLKRIVEMCKPSKVHVLYTDTEVQRHDEFEKPEDMEIEFVSGGGTDMLAGFHFAEENEIEAEVFITLTDGYTDFPEDGQFATPAIWCISTDKVSPSGETINFSIG